MIVIAWSFFMIISMVLMSTQALVPMPGQNGHAMFGSIISEDVEKITTTSKRPTVKTDHRDYDVPHDRGSDSVFESSKDNHDVQSALDPWSIVWYIGSFGGLVAFFLIVSCSEWFCRRSARPISVPYTQRNDVMNGTSGPIETPPPPYHLFAPPPYDSVNYGDLADKTSGEKVDIYVISVPIHQSSVRQSPA